MVESWYIVAPSMTYVFVPHANETKFAKIQSWPGRLAKTSWPRPRNRPWKPKAKPQPQHARVQRPRSPPIKKEEPLSVIRHRWLDFPVAFGIYVVIFQPWQLANISMYCIQGGNNEFELHDRWQDAQQPQLCFVDCLKKNSLLTLATKNGWGKKRGAPQILWVVQQAARRVGRRLNISTTHWMDGWLVGGLKNKRTAFLCSRCVLFYKRKLMIFHELSDNKACIMSEKRK